VTKRLGAHASSEIKKTWATTCTARQVHALRTARHRHGTADDTAGGRSQLRDGPWSPTRPRRSRGLLGAMEGSLTEDTTLGKSRDAQPAPVLTDSLSVSGNLIYDRACARPPRRRWATR